LSGKIQAVTNKNKKMDRKLFMDNPDRRQTKPEMPAAKQAELEKARKKAQASLEPEIKEAVKQEKLNT
jgi:hypothetical protein